MADPERGLGAFRTSTPTTRRCSRWRSTRTATRATALNAARTGRHAASPAADGTRVLDTPALAALLERRALLYDKSGEEHYNIISALHKSIRNSDADAAVYWLARMLEAGEDPLYVARRLVRFASEDIGNADPRALDLAIAAKDAVALSRHAGRQHRARAGRHLHGGGAQEQRGLSRLLARGARRARRTSPSPSRSTSATRRPD